MGQVLGLGPDRDMVFDRMADIWHLFAHQVEQRLEGNKGGIVANWLHIHFDIFIVWCGPGVWQYSFSLHGSIIFFIMEKRIAAHL